MSLGSGSARTALSTYLPQGNSRAAPIFPPRPVVHELQGVCTLSTSVSLPAARKRLHIGEKLQEFSGQTQPQSKLSSPSDWTEDSQTLSLGTPWSLLEFTNIDVNVSPGNIPWVGNIPTLPLAAYNSGYQVGISQSILESWMATEFSLSLPVTERAWIMGVEGVLRGPPQYSCCPDSETLLEVSPRAQKKESKESRCQSHTWIQSCVFLEPEMSDFSPSNKVLWKRTRRSTKVKDPMGLSIIYRLSKSCLGQTEVISQAGLGGRNLQGAWHCKPGRESAWSNLKSLK